MIDEQLVHMIEKSAPAIAGKWTREILSCQYTPTYRKFSEGELNERSRRVYEGLGKWLDMDTSSGEISREYSNLGRKRYQEGFPLGEVLHALHITKKILWRHIISSGVMKSALDLYRAMDLIVRLFHFYDMAAFFICRGYQDELYHAVSATSKRSGRVLEELFRIPVADDEKILSQAGTRSWLESWNLFKTK